MTDLQLKNKNKWFLNGRYVKYLKSEYNDYRNIVQILECNHDGACILIGKYNKDGIEIYESNINEIVPVIFEPFKLCEALGLVGYYCVGDNCDFVIENVTKNAFGHVKVNGHRVDKLLLLDYGYLLIDNFYIPFGFPKELTFEECETEKKWSVWDWLMLPIRLIDKLLTCCLKNRSVSKVRCGLLGIKYFKRVCLIKQCK